MSFCELDSEVKVVDTNVYSSICVLELRNNESLRKHREKANITRVSNVVRNLSPNTIMLSSTVKASPMAKVVYFLICRSLLPSTTTLVAPS